MGVQSLLHVALLKMLVHSLRYGHVEGVRLAIEKGVNLKHIDKRGRNLLMLAIKQDTDTRLRISVILADAGCDINHTDARGWSCLHYACAGGAIDVVHELLRRGVHVEYNIFGFGASDLSFPRVQKARSLLQHTEMLSHETAVRVCWGIVDKHMADRGYTLEIPAPTHEFKKPLKVMFHAPPDHSHLDRIRVVDLQSSVPVWEQTSRTIPVPPGHVGCITLDAEVLDVPSMYRIYYEQYRPTPVALSTEAMRALEDTLCVKDLDSGQTVSVKSVNDLVLRQRGNNQAVSDNQDPTEDSRALELSTLESCSSASDDWETSSVSSEVVPPAVVAATGAHRFAAMATLSLVRLEPPKPQRKTESLYDIVVTTPGQIGLSLEGVADAKGQRVKIVVVALSPAFQSAFPGVNVGDCLVGINNHTHVEYAGMQHTLWALTDATRPLTLRFRQESKDRPRLFRSLYRKRSSVSSV
ncbi:hypothetical protein SDRG_06941 [Saprolegnia diclina VS20]|uniref:PDZ domain-containing protein n=1 Tax=Saprolegnia diclina (strain VS20) TaxID=1156394 RepID=T0RZ79_SAPDV|nr:hypothetical protein SDRG_06941 [Saprolegnia diclina VS20]EQC35657.1 hypothetical protein SDRG_06941 [Saprolegnia diclina VS20]|eukprot:XP_008610974.1 hypothetical protein SDRG_06941 [Saprolegnia diclina VS20]